MRLLTHNMLRCNKKGVTSGYPLRIEIATDPETGAHVDGAVQVSEAEFNAEFIVRTLPKLEWGPFLQAAREIGVDGVDQLPQAISQQQAAGLDESFLRLVHHALLEVRLCEGSPICPESGRRFPVANSIPNMLLREDEV